MTKETPRKSRILPALALIVILAAAAAGFIHFGNPQWHWRLYAFQARQAEDGLLDAGPNYSGVWRNWAADGRLVSEYTYRNGKRHGRYVHYTESGAIRSEGQYNDGALDGMQYVYGDDGVKTEIPYQNGRRHGVERSFFADGSVAIEAPWVDGVQDGPVNFYFENGSIQASIPFYQGKRQGVMKTWYEHGQLQGDETYQNDVRNGRSEFYGPDGTPSMTFNFLDDAMDGVQTWYHPNGEKSREAEMKMGVPDGRWKEWNEDGKLVVDEVYENGALKMRDGEKVGPSGETEAGTAGEAEAGDDAGQDVGGGTGSEAGAASVNGTADSPLPATAPEADSDPESVMGEGAESDSDRLSDRPSAQEDVDAEAE
ncbi:MAG: hypothetical protein LIQ30_11235 [Planctomycetes bacterium]|nr:hypothetical protein [Planctomycetota bacterium]